MKMTLITLPFISTLLAASSVFASSPKTFSCDMRDLSVNDMTTGRYQLQISSNEAVLSAGNIVADSEVATLLQVNSLSKSSTVFLHEDETGRIEQSFDLLPSGEAGILIWRIYGWQNPFNSSPINKFVFICNKL